MGYVIVECPGPKRSVLVNGTSQGDNKSVDGTYRILTVEDGVHTFSLAGSEDHDPPQQTVVVAGTSPIQPLRVRFRKKA
ncbi:MAG: hypothetical protein HYY95_22470 [Candidatus Rokubacteria bacterium]|nr:hypothetical protein [Candidatus Rokubacteria bacterium]